VLGEDDQMEPETFLISSLTLGSATGRAAWQLKATPFIPKDSALDDVAQPGETVEKQAG